MAWNPLGGPFNPNRVKALGTQPLFPATGVEEAQGLLLPRPIAEELAVPQDLGVNLQGFVNPYSLTFYSYPVGTTAPTRVMPPNIRRTYLLMQNQGPGNIWINFGQDVTIATGAQNSNGFQMVQTQAYEQIGGGYVDPYGHSIPNSFVSPDYLSVITDTAGTTILIGEGVWRPQQQPY